MPVVEGVENTHIIHFLWIYHTHINTYIYIYKHIYIYIYFFLLFQHRRPRPVMVTAPNWDVRRGCSRVQNEVLSYQDEHPKDTACQGCQVDNPQDLRPQIASSGVPRPNTRWQNRMLQGIPWALLCETFHQQPCQWCRPSATPCKTGNSPWCCQHSQGHGPTSDVSAWHLQRRKILVGIADDHSQGDFQVVEGPLFSKWMGLPSHPPVRPDVPGWKAIPPATAHRPAGDSLPEGHSQPWLDPTQSTVGVTCPPTPVWFAQGVALNLWWGLFCEQLTRTHMEAPPKYTLWHLVE